MAPLPITKEGIWMKCRNSGIEIFMIICSMLILFKDGYIKAIMPSGIPNWVTFILPFYLGYLAYVGWGLIQMGKLIRDDEGKKRHTPAQMLLLFKGSKEQVMSRLYVNGVINFVICAALFALLGLGLAKNKISGMWDNLLVSLAIVTFFSYHGYLGFVLLKLSEMINTNPSLFHIGGNAVSGEAEYHTDSMRLTSASVGSAEGVDEGVEKKVINKKQEENR